MIIRETYSYFYEIIGLHPVYIYFNESKEEKYKNSKTMHIYMTPCKEEDGVCFTFVLRSVKFSSKIDSFSFLIKCVSDNRRQRTSLDQKDCSLALTIDICGIPSTIRLVILYNKKYTVQHILNQICIFFSPRSL